ncbi:carbamoyl-phosphate synthase [Phakopsora pachyrhizi]|uniref:Carbamoyl-phosphate synthase n=1 Tax=Phakopsora pachyrhizi TaxID=170000 RepID=A0AAV0BGQ1_PHAPC|nr:carbamoyl-phosphate synthase [Phakopsora pachyrhizi]
MALELADGTIYQGYRFGVHKKSISRECAFQTGMVGYPESSTDFLYEGQILVLTYPLNGSYGVPERNGNLLSNHLESSRIHFPALEYSHYLASSSLGKWLQDEGIPAIYGVNTRDLTKRIRKGGIIMEKLLAKDALKPKSLKANVSKLSNTQQTRESLQSEYIDVALKDPNEKDLVEDVSRREPCLCKISDLPSGSQRIYPIMHPKMPRAIWILALNNSSVVKPGSFDGLFISNGPGDPKLAEDTIQCIRQATEMKEFSNFGICLGHKLLALAVGAKTLKLKYGNWGQNIPCNNLQSGQCYIASQNHGVQFHPESAAGPQDAKFLFDIFLQSAIACLQDGSFLPVTMPGGSHFENSLKNPRVLVKKVLAIKVLKQERVYTILINPNIATIQTTKGLADKVYFLPITPEFVRRVI